MSSTRPSIAGIKEVNLTCPCGCGETFMMRFRKSMEGKTEFLRAFHIGHHDYGLEVIDYANSVGPDHIHQLCHEFDLFNTWEEGNEQPQA